MKVVLRPSFPNDTDPVDALPGDRGVYFIFKFKWNDAYIPDSESAFWNAAQDGELQSGTVKYNRDSGQLIFLTLSKKLWKGKVAEGDLSVADHLFSVRMMQYGARLDLERHAVQPLQLQEPPQVPVPFEEGPTFYDTLSEPQLDATPIGPVSRKRTRDFSTRPTSRQITVQQKAAAAKLAEDQRNAEALRQAAERSQQMREQNQRRKARLVAASAAAPPLAYVSAAAAAAAAAAAPVAAALPVAAAPVAVAAAAPVAAAFPRFTPAMAAAASRPAALPTLVGRDERIADAEEAMYASMRSRQQEEPQYTRYERVARSQMTRPPPYATIRRDELSTGEWRENKVEPSRAVTYDTALGTRRGRERTGFEYK